MAEEIPPLHPSAFDSADAHQYAEPLSLLWTSLFYASSLPDMPDREDFHSMHSDPQEGPVQLTIVPNVYKVPTYLQRLDEGVRQEIYRFCTTVLYARKAEYCCCYAHEICKVCTWNALFDETEIRHDRCPNMSLCLRFFEQRKRKLQP